MKKFIKVWLALYMMVLFMNVAMAAENETDKETSLSVLGTEQSQQSVVVDTSPQMNEIKEEKISALTGLGSVIKTAVANGICDIPNNVNEAAECVMKVASREDVLSFDQAYLLRKVTIEGADPDYRTAFILLNPEIFNEYASEQEREIMESYRDSYDENKRKMLAAIDNNEPNIESADYYYYRGIKDFKRSRDSISEMYTSEWNKILDSSLSDEFISEKTAQVYGLANGDDDSLARLALSNYKKFASHATNKEMQAATRGLLEGETSASSIFEKRQTLLEDIQAGRQDAPMEKMTVDVEIKNPSLKKAGAMAFAIAGAAPLTIAGMVGVGLGIPSSLMFGETGANVAAGIGMVAGGGVAVAEGAFAIKGATAVAQAIGDVIAASPAIIVPAASTVALWNGVEQYMDWEVNPSKYSERGANIINRELEKPIEEQDVMD